MGLRVHVETFGCQMNKLDSDLVLSALQSAGHERASSMEEADVVLVNTCSVRRHAEDRVYSRVGVLARRKRRTGRPIIGIMGCMAQKEGRRLLQRIPELDLVVGTRAFVRMPEIIADVRAGAGPVLALDGDAAVLEEGALSGNASGIRHAFVSVMRGCENYCSYCVVPYVRGPEVSRPPDRIVEQVRSLAGSGVLEVTLLGQNVNSYGAKSSRGWNLADLLARLNGIEGLRRIRFITNHPRDMTGPILEAMRDLPKVMESLHVPAQSGSDGILAAMNRRYTREDYLSVVALARELVPGIDLTGDFIVGFPGETDRDFRLTADLLARCEYRNAYIFKYSSRPGTAAARLEDDVPDETKRARHAELLALQGEISERRHGRLVGGLQEVLVEGPSKRDKLRFTGRSRGDHIVIIDDGKHLVGKIAPIRIHSSTKLALYGKAGDTGIGDS